MCVCVCTSVWLSVSTLAGEPLDQFWCDFCKVISVVRSSSKMVTLGKRSRPQSPKISKIGNKFAKNSSSAFLSCYIRYLVQLLWWSQWSSWGTQRCPRVSHLGPLLRSMFLFLSCCRVGTTEVYAPVFESQKFKYAYLWISFLPSDRVCYYCHFDTKYGHIVQKVKL